ncbi:MAG TPA: ATP-binding protein [Streptomyces sp.]|nr:ATP-binding protein [Streptomyces sp.]
MAPPSPVGPSPRHRDPGPEPKRHWQLPAHDGSVGLARRRVREALAQWDAHSDVADDATLVISELATNVIAHTDSPVLILTLRLDTTRLRIEVEDRCPGRGRPRPGLCRPDDESGRGLLIVAQLADAWGTAPNPATTGSLVWAELPWRRTGAATEGRGHTERTERGSRVRPLPGPAEPPAPRHSAPGHPPQGRPSRPAHAPHAHASYADTPHPHTPYAHPDVPHTHTPYGHVSHADAPYASHAHTPHAHASCGDAAHPHTAHPHSCHDAAHAHPPHSHGASVRPPETGSVRA